ncbi:MAG: 50S ribosomal protein L4 [Anaerolineales bacterium]|jgi:large subunit ribosomal protein L4|uniref:50S ribosomal protein L4 n=1 Tax=Candidatus Villigracilis vicinus TaxID=3140679 RepID=UPI0031369CA3|nr:50S ribosomal protein L4 [Anaerolineales bacterium]MBK7450977.1 50S ribosomal protein L4 [Anaerolineales bacterium]MBK9779038.1 50S ribosomal protein L4 [Anaerolineales bacterium]
MKVDVLDMKGKKVREIELPANLFEAPVNMDLMHQAYTRQMANARLGTHDTKTRGEVRGGGRKPWKQKGTGRARQGSRRAAQWVGGGRIHTPHPRSYELRMPKKMRLAALRSALSVKASEASIVVVEELNIEEPKTKLVAEALGNLVGTSTVLVLMPTKDQNYDLVMRSANNIDSAKVLLASYLNVRDILNFDKVVLPVKTIDALVAHLG